MTLRDRLTRPGPKRVLALDGGGMRGAITLGYLVELERILSERHGRRVAFNEYFDLIGGTSTGAVIAAGLASGMATQELLDLYKNLGRDVFGRKRRGVKRVRAFFDAAGLEHQLDQYFGDRKLDDESITTGLCIVAKRADTRSTWPLMNHPDGKFFEQNRHVAIATALRASTAAPAVFEPAAVDVGDGEIGAFVDGGVSTAKNPALMLFLIATLQGYPFHWNTGKDELLLLSVGTGFWSDKIEPAEVLNRRLWNWAIEIPGLFIEDVAWLNQLLLQAFSDTKTPWEIDAEVGDLSGDLLTREPLLTYLRYDVELDKPGLDELNLAELAANLDSLRDMTRAENVDDLAEIGRRAARAQIQPDHLPSAFDL